MRARFCAAADRKKQKKKHWQRVGCRGRGVRKRGRRASFSSIVVFQEEQKEDFEMKEENKKRKRRWKPILEELERAERERKR